MNDPATLAARYDDVVRRVHLAAIGAGRRPDEVTIIAVTKMFDSETVRALSAAGVADFGENKAQELLEKHSQCFDLQARWHFVGQLQRNKARVVAEVATAVHSVDRPSLVAALGKAVAAVDRPPLSCLIQVNLDPEPVPGRGGISRDMATDLADEVAQTPGLELSGVMGVASLTEPASESYRLLAEVHNLVRQNHPTATMMSAGMSNDFPEAIAAGATHVRLGAVLLGPRPKLG